MDYVKGAQHSPKSASSPLLKIRFMDYLTAAVAKMAQRCNRLNPPYNIFLFLLAKVIYNTD